MHTPTLHRHAYTHAQTQDNLEGDKSAVPFSEDKPERKDSDTILPKTHDAGRPHLQALVCARVIRSEVCVCGVGWVCVCVCGGGSEVLPWGGKIERT